jgi:hypothetical protein
MRGRIIVLFLGAVWYLVFLMLGLLWEFGLGHWRRGKLDWRRLEGLEGLEMLISC